MEQQPTEAWLVSSDREEVIDVIMKCQHLATFCFADEYCHLDEECFIPAWVDGLLEDLEG
ncbi:MAG: hypothetical protein O2913_10245 [Chloroflexi bacterium]|nr:hypothetical protein [Chloroflexota bacterium]